MTEQKTAFPLCWPDSKQRTPIYQRRHARFKTSFAKARSNLIHEIELLGGTNMIFSSDIPRRQDGLPYADAKPKSGDPGIACYFNRKGKQFCFACDCYLTVDDNMHAIALTIASLRGIARWGTGDMMEAAFRGFAALPAVGQSSGDRPWEVLGIAINATEAQMLEAYRHLSKKYHPDNPETGDADRFLRIKNAYDLMAQNVRKTAS